MQRLEGAGPQLGGEVLCAVLLAVALQDVERLQVNRLQEEGDQTCLNSGGPPRTASPHCDLMNTLLPACCRHMQKQGFHRLVCSTFVLLAFLPMCSCFTAPTPPPIFTWATPSFCLLTAELFLGVSRPAGAEGGWPVFRGLLLTGLVSAGVRGRRPVLRGLSLAGRSVRGFLRGIRVTGDCDSSAAVNFLLVGVKTSWKNEVTSYNV